MQLSLDDGLRLRNDGLNAIEDTDRDFVATMRATAARISQECGSVTSDDLRMEADALGMSPRHPNVWGSIFRGPHWKIIGRKRSEVPSNHARELKVWQYAA